jgi:hypothetical protein
MLDPQILEKIKLEKEGNIPNINKKVYLLKTSFSCPEYQG